MDQPNDLTPPGGFPQERRVRLGRLAKHETIEAVAHCDVHHFISSQFAAPAFEVREIAIECGLKVIEGPLKGDAIGAFNPDEDLITVDRCRIVEHHPPESVEGVVRSTIAHELAHARLHRYVMAMASPGPGLYWYCERSEQEARVYAAAFLLPRAHLEVNETLLSLQERRDAGQDVPEFYLWARLQAVAVRFGVTRSLVVERLVKLGFLVRQGRLVRLASCQESLLRTLEWERKQVEAEISRLERERHRAERERDRLRAQLEGVL